MVSFSLLTNFLALATVQIQSQVIFLHHKKQPAKVYQLDQVTNAMQPVLGGLQYLTIQRNSVQQILAKTRHSSRKKVYLDTVVRIRPRTPHMSPLPTLLLVAEAAAAACTAGFDADILMTDGEGWEGALEMGASNN